MSISRTLLTHDEVQAKLGALPGWSVENDRLLKTFKFTDFVAAFAWMTEVALVAERLGHHPNWSNVYNTVEVTLWTHDVGGLTEFDLVLAKAMNDSAARRQGG
jgi:4a-hydroxytetrahydrobiopterin dehydratase